MAYNCKPLPCLRIQRFSSANSTYDGIALGGETADNGKWTKSLQSFALVITMNLTPFFGLLG